MKGIILWTLFVPGQPLPAATNLTNQQCQTMANNLAPRSSDLPYKVRQKLKPYCKPQV